MSTIMLRIVILVLSVLAQPSPVPPSPVPQVTHCPNTSAPLAQRMQWAAEQAKRLSAHQDYWVGYYVERLMEEDSHVGNWSAVKQGVSLAELIYGKEEEPGSPDPSATKEQRKVAKRVAIIFGYEATSGLINRVEVHNLSLTLDLKGRPLLWLGAGENSQSLSLLEQQYKSASTAAAKGGILTAVALHRGADAVASFYRRALDQREEERVRAKAAYWLSVKVDSWLDDPNDAQTYLTVLLETAFLDKSPEVREQTLSGIGQMNLSAATDALIGLIRNESDMKVRKEMILWLAQRSSDRTVDALKNLMDESRDAEAQKQFLIGFWHMPNYRGIPILIEIARTHASPEVRKEAVYWLGQSKDPRAHDALKEISREQ